MTFHELHAGEHPLVLPNAWDVASALAFFDAGFPAVGTTSFGLAGAHGDPDGGRTTGLATRELASRLAVLPCYISVDIEDGYDDDPERVADYVADLGVDGINIEDSSAENLIAPGLHAAKIRAITGRAPGIFVNARVDTYWLGQDASVAATLDRALAYVEAGAHGIFVPGCSKPAELRELTANIPVPVNVLPIPELTITQLAELGVRRISTGSLPYRAAIDTALDVASSVRDGRPLPTATPYQAMQERLERFHRLHGGGQDG